MAITSYKAVVGYYNSAGTPNITTAVTDQLSDGWIPIGAPILTDAYGQCTQMMAKTDGVTTSAYTVVTAANPQPPDATWDAQGEPLWIDTVTYLQAYTKGGAYIRGVVPVLHGGTGATTAAAARTNLGVPATTDVLLKADNLASLADRAAAWLNVRPIGSTPLAADPVDPLDATTKQWVEGLRSVEDSWTALVNVDTPPANGITVHGGMIKSDYTIAGASLTQGYLRSAAVTGGPAANRGVAIGNGTHELWFNQNGTLYLPDAPYQIGTSRPDGYVIINGRISTVSLTVQAGNNIAVAPSENNGIRMVNYGAVPSGGYINTIGGDWYTGSWQLGGVRSAGPDLMGVQLNVHANSASGIAAYQFGADGVASCPEWRSTSDERIKSNISRIADPLLKMRKIKGVSWTLETNGSTGYGFIAQDVEHDFPGAVSESPFAATTLRNGTVVDRVKTVNTSGVSSALHHEAILALMDKIEALETRIASLESGK